MTLRQTLLATALATSLAMACGVSSAATLRVANQGDSNSMDPHSLNESLQLSFTGNIYEPLVGRDKKLALTPALATSWKQTSPTVWRFELRKGPIFANLILADEINRATPKTQSALLEFR